MPSHTTSQLQSALPCSKAEHFTENVHFELAFPNGKASSHGGHNKVEHMLSVKTFKKMCMIAKTSRADTVRDYYIKMEEILMDQIAIERRQAQGTALFEKEAAIIALVNYFGTPCCVTMHSLPVRLKAVIYCQDFSMSIRKAATLCGVSKSSVQRWVKTHPCQKQTSRFPKARRRRYSQCVVDYVKSTLEQNPFCTGIDLVQSVHSKFGLKLSQTTLQRIRKSLGFKYKISTRSQAGQRANVSHPLFQDLTVFDDAIAVDESSFLSSDRPRRGWALAGNRVPKCPPVGRKRVSILLAIDRNGVVELEHCKGAYNSQRFSQFIQKLPMHRRIILDNVAFHKSKVVASAALERGQTLCFTPPYCPWFNPVEYAFSVSKSAYRYARLNNRPDFVLDAVNCIETRVNSVQCKNFFDHAHQNAINELQYCKTT